MTEKRIVPHITFPRLAEIHKVMAVAIKVVSPETEEKAKKHLANARLARKHLIEDVKKLCEPFQTEIENIKLAATPWLQLLQGKDATLEEAIIQYRMAVRKKVAAFNTKALGRYEEQAAAAQQEAVEAGKPTKIVIPPALKAEPEKSTEVDGARVTEIKHWTWDGIAGVPDGQKGAKKLTYTEAKALGLDLPEDWFKLDTAKVTAAVKRQDRVPACVLQREDHGLSVTELEEEEVAS